jgi:hypothetical protein
MLNAEIVIFFVIKKFSFKANALKFFDFVPLLLIFLRYLEFR